jgi:hypothetical protein
MNAAFVEHIHEVFVPEMEKSVFLGVGQLVAFVERWKSSGGTTKNR